jgi:hypothetical protein
MLNQHPQNLSWDDVVRLNSGGPQLTVVAVDGDLITVVWIGDETDRDGKCEFPRACLQKI